MSETIQSIKEVSIPGDWSGMDGYEIQTSKRKISVLISNEQSCCEDWGYCSSDDNLDEYVGAELLSMNTTDKNLDTWEFERGYEGGAQFVTFNTSKGAFQLAVYNWHNGYYGHDIKVSSDDEVLIDDCL